MHGRGIDTHRSGDVYEGEWDRGYREGRGTMRKGPRTRTAWRVYEGEWSFSHPSGRGAFTYADGSVYEGEVRGYTGDGWPSGRGTFTYPDGRVSEGVWRMGAWGGHTSERRQLDLLHPRLGRGTTQFADGRVFEGEYLGGGRVRGRERAHGTMRWPDGRTYEGQCAADSRHGHGIMRHPDGRVYDGEWQAARARRIRSAEARGRHTRRVLGGGRVGRPGRGAGCGEGGGGGGGGGGDRHDWPCDGEAAVRV